MKEETKKAFISILKEELVPATGCTEPISVAYASSIASHVLGGLPERIDVYVSGNIIKNVKSVVVPGTNGLKGIETAVAAGAIASKPEKELQVLSSLTDEERCEIKKYLDRNVISVHHSRRNYTFSIVIDAFLSGHEAVVEIAGSHTNVVSVILDGRTLHKKEFIESSAGEKTSRDELDIKSIVEFASTVDIVNIEEIIGRQIKYNTAIAEEGLRNPWGANIGRIILSSYPDDIHNRAKAYAAAGSDARMNGSKMPVIINSGSGNQGITVSIPVIVYAGSMKVERELLLRALVVSNLVAIHIKAKIGPLSAYCGATSAACGASSGISYLHGGREVEIAHSVVNTLAILSGMICDGAKASCAAKIASAVEAGLLGFEMTRNGSEFLSGDGIVTKGVENTINNIVELATVGMRETDRTIIGIMTGECR